MAEFDIVGGDELRGWSASGLIVGGAGADTLVGGAGPETLFGLAGNDSIVGGAGFNQVNGNQGDDTIIGHSTVGDWLLGGQGSDRIDASGSTGGNIINGNAGNDTLIGGAGADSLRGGQGDDEIHAGSGNAWISGDLGRNTIYGGQGQDTFHAGAGFDVVYGWHAGDQVQVDSGVTGTATQVGADVNIAFSNGGEMDLVSTQLSGLSGAWASGGQLTVVAPPPPPFYGQFTTGRDTLSTTDGTHVYTATLGGSAPTLTTGDSLHGAGNTLAITDSSTATSTDLLPSGLSLTGVATVSLTTTGNAGVDAAHPFDLSGFTGISQFSLTAAGVHGDFLAVGAGTAISLQTASATVDITGGAGSSIHAITDPALTSLTVSGDVALGSSTSPFTLPASLTTLDLSGDTAASSVVAPNATGATITLGASDTLTAGDGANTITITGASDHITVGNGANTIIDQSTGAGGSSITVGNGFNTIDLQGHAGDVVHVGVDSNFNVDPITPSVVIENAVAGDLIEFTNAPGGLAYFSSFTTPATTFADFITLLDDSVVGNPRSAVAATYGPDTYIVESATGIIGPTDTVIIKLTGIHDINFSMNPGSFGQLWIAA